MKAMECVSKPVRFTSSWQRASEREFFDKQLARAKRLEKRCIKAGFTPCGELETLIIGDIEYQRLVYSHKPTMEKYTSEVLKALNEGFLGALRG